jgi:hypothetical protein
MPRSKEITEARQRDGAINKERAAGLGMAWVAVPALRGPASSHSVSRADRVSPSVPERSGKADRRRREERPAIPAPALAGYQEEVSRQDGRVPPRLAVAGIRADEHPRLPGLRHRAGTGRVELRRPFDKPPGLDGECSGEVGRPPVRSRQNLLPRWRGSYIGSELRCVA